MYYREDSELPLVQELHVMNREPTHLNQKVWRILDQRGHESALDAIDSFAMDDTLCASVGGKLSPPTARLWVHRDTVVLGIQDTRLPFIAEGLNYLEAKGYRVIVRNSGGLAVVLDEGVLNISLVMPVDRPFADIDDGFEAMRQLVEELLHPYVRHIAVGEVEGSYCPGRYDLSIRGVKFAGISQRRTKGGMAVQVFLLVSGSGRRRAEVLKQFYQLAGAAQEPRGKLFPSINPETMASLTELLSIGMNTDMLKQRLVEVLQNRSSRIITTSRFPFEEERFQLNRRRMVERNEKSLYKFDKIKREMPL